MDFQQVYVYEFRCPERAEPALPENRFFTGLFNAVMVSVPLWVLIAWGVKALL